MQELDPLTCIAVAAVLALTAALAGCLPARRVTPIDAARAEQVALPTYSLVDRAARPPAAD